MFPPLVLASALLLAEAHLFPDLSPVAEVLHSRTRSRRDLDGAGRLHALAGMIDTITANKFNVTLIGWQHIHNSEGIQGVASVRLAFINRVPADADTDDDGDDPVRSDQHMIKNFQPFLSLTRNKVWTSVIGERWNRKGEEIGFIFWDKSRTFFRVDNVASYNETREGATKEEVAEFLKELEEKQKELKREFYSPVLKVTFKEFPDAGLNRSEIATPSVVAYVEDFQNVQDEVITESALILTRIYLTTKPENVAQELVKEFDQRFDQYDWNVLINPGQTFVSYDAYVTLSLDGFSFYDTDPPIYMVFGVNKN